MLEKREGGLRDDMQDAHASLWRRGRMSRVGRDAEGRRPDLEILDEALEKGDKVLRLPDIPRNGFCEQIFGKHWRHTR